MTLSFFLGFLQEDYAYRVLPEMRKQSRAEVLDHIFDLASPTRVLELGMSKERLDNWAKLAYQLKVISREYDPRYEGITIMSQIFK